MSWRILAGVFLGWGLGANDAANVFGTAVSAQMVRWRTAAVLIAVFALLGAMLQGGGGLDTYSRLSAQDTTSAFYTALAAGVAVLLLTLLHLPVSTSQAAVGAILGIGFARIQTGAMDPSALELGGLWRIVACWIGTPIGACLLTLVLYPLLAALVRWWHPHFLTYDALMRTLLILAGVYGAYALGANNVANVTGVFYGAGSFGEVGTDTARAWALLVGGASIGFGAFTYSRHVMLTVGQSIVKLDAFSSFIVVLSQAATVHLYAEVGVPVSTSQAVVGAVIGIGVLQGGRTIRGWAVVRILSGWVVTPVIAMGVAYLLWMVGSG